MSFYDRKLGLFRAGGSPIFLLRFSCVKTRKIAVKQLMLLVCSLHAFVPMTSSPPQRAFTMAHREAYRSLEKKSMKQLMSSAVLERLTSRH